MAIILKKQTGAATTTPSTGKVTFYVDSADGLPKYKDENAAIGSFVGPQGPTGNTGATGPQPALSSLTPSTLTVGGSGSAGVSSIASASDHNHPMPGLASISVSGFLSAADKSRMDNWFNKSFYDVLDNGISPSNSASANVTAWNTLMGTITDGATVFFPVGTYQVASELAIPSGKHIRVVGAGKNGKTIIQTTSGTANIFNCQDWYQEFQGLSFSSSITRTAGAAILSGNNVGISVYSCSFAGMFNGVVFSGGANAGNIGIVSDSNFTNIVNFSIQIDGTNANAFISKCTADGSPAAVAHVEVNACGSLLISDSDFIRATNNMRLNPDSGIKGVFSVYCSNVFFDTAAGSSVKFQGGATGTNIQRVKFVNCWFSGSVNGCEFAAATSTNKASAIDFINCDIYSNSANGILATEVQDFSLNTCRIAGNATAGINTLATVGSMTKFNIQNCTVGPTAGIGANTIGINIQAGTYGAYNITGNNVTGNTSNNNITDNGTVATTDLKKVKDNLGHLCSGAIGIANNNSTSGTGETLLMSARIPANSVQVGQVFRVRLFGNSSSTGTLAIKVKVGANGTIADTAIWTPATSSAQIANHRSSIECYIMIKSIGAAGTASGEGVARFSNVFVEEATIAAPATTTINTQNPWFIDVTCAATIGAFTAIHGVIEVI